MFHKTKNSRPEHLWQTFIVLTKRENIAGRGRVLEEYSTTEVKIKAILCSASPKAKQEFHQLGHPVSHIISQRGKPVAKCGDLLVMNGRIFIVCGVENPGELNVWAVYNCEERTGIHGTDQVDRAKQ